MDEDVVLEDAVATEQTVAVMEDDVADVVVAVVIMVVMVVVVVVVVIDVVAHNVVTTGVVDVAVVVIAEKVSVDVFAVDAAANTVNPPRCVEAPRLWILLTLPLLLRRLLADAKPLPLLATVPLPRPIGRETGGNSGLTVFTNVPGVIGVAGVGCMHMCTIRGSAFNVVVDEGTAIAVVVVVGIGFADNDAFAPPICC